MPFKLRAGPLFPQRTTGGLPRCSGYALSTSFQPASRPRRYFAAFAPDERNGCVAARRTKWSNPPQPQQAPPYPGTLPLQLFRQSGDSLLNQLIEVEDGQQNGEDDDKNQSPHDQDQHRFE